MEGNYFFADHVYKDLNNDKNVLVSYTAGTMNTCSSPILNI